MAEAKPARSTKGSAKPQQGSGDVKARQKASRKSRADQRIKTCEELAAELQALRSTLDEVVAQLQVRLGAGLADIERAAMGSGGDRSKTALLPASVMATMVREIRAVKVKPRKGRAKDIVRLADLVEDLIDHLPSSS